MKGFRLSCPVSNTRSLIPHSESLVLSYSFRILSVGRIYIVLQPMMCPHVLMYESKTVVLTLLDNSQVHNTNTISSEHFMKKYIKWVV
jgi:hypothetical protein